MVNFEVGEKVYIKSGNYSGRIETIDGKTKSGNLKVGANIFYPNGSLRGGGTYSTTQMQKLTHETECLLERNNTIVEIMRTPWTRVRCETLDKILELLRKESK